MDNSTTAGNARVSDRAARTAHETIDRLHEQAARVEDELRSSTADAADKARQSGERAAASLEGATRQVTSYIEQNPLTSAALAFAAGIVVSSLLRRR